MKINNTVHSLFNYEPFHPAYGLQHKHFQTIFPTLFRKKIKQALTIERFELSDGDFVECYWSNPPIEESQKPIVVLFHGLTGSYQSPYIQGMMSTLEKEGFSSVLMHFRGCSGEMNRLPRSYHSGDTADAKAWTDELRRRYPDSPLFAIGYSIGGNMLLKLLGEWGQLSPLKAAVSVSAPLQLDTCASRMDQGFSKFYQYALLKELKCSLLKKYKKHDITSMIGLEEKEVHNLKTFWAFDNVYTGPIHGFKNAEDYYQKSSSKQYLQKISCNTLIIHAMDDPFMPPEALPEQDTMPANVKLEIHESGGHLGFVSNHLFKPQYWLENRISHFFKMNNTL